MSYSQLFTDEEFNTWAIKLFSELSVAKVVELMEVFDSFDGDLSTPEGFLAEMVSGKEMEEEEWPLAVIDPSTLGADGYAMLYMQDGIES